MTTRRVFISSTAKDLEEHRKAVALAIERLDLGTVRMEAFVAEPGTPVDVCRKKASEADVLVAIVAHRYGWVPTPEEGGDGERSITWLEVDSAEHVLAFLVKADYPWTHGKESDDLATAATAEDATPIFARVRALQRLKAYLEKKNVRAEFTTPDSLGGLVTASLVKWAMPEIGPTEPPGDALRRYLEALEHATAFLSIQGIASAHGSVRAAARQPIEALYTPLRSRGVTDASPAGGLRGESVALGSLLPAHLHLLIEGQPGAGKSTFLKLAACMLARDRLGMACPDGAAWSHRHLGLTAATSPPVPVLLPMGELVPLLTKKDRPKRDRKELWLLDLLDRRCHDDEIDVPRASWLKLLEAGDAVLLLDGLDEVAERQLRDETFEIVRAALERWPKCRVVVTSRPIETAALREMGFHHATIEPFDLAAIEEFTRRWVTALYGVADATALAPEGRRYLDQLTTAITGRSRIRQIAANPVMLTCLCVVHWSERRLPEGKAHVYRAVIRWLLAAREEQRTKAGYSQRFAETAFASLALAMIGPGEGDSKRSSIDLGEAAGVIDDAVRREWRDLDRREERTRRAREWLEFECLGSGIVEMVAGRRIRFWHLTFQEYLAAQQLAWMEDGEEGEGNWWPIVRGRLTDAQWRETVDLFPGCLLDKGNGPVDRLLGRVLDQRVMMKGDLALDARMAGIVGRLLDHVRVYGYQPEPAVDERYGKVLERAKEIFTREGAARVPVRDRIAAAEALGQGGDYRLVSFRDNLLAVPGKPGVLLGKYPVTAEEYQQFTEAGRGYETERYWSAEGWAAKEGNGWKEPGSWEEQLRTPNRPVVEVSWYEVEAYCRWQAELSSLSARLPTEEEWFAAAKPADGEYPWGSAEPTEELANFSSNVGAPTPVGVYPTGAGHGGHLDLAGNVWEWCSDDRRPGRAQRGGGWYDVALGLRAAYRGESGGDADARGGLLGFRVAVEAASTVDR